MPGRVRVTPSVRLLEVDPDLAREVPEARAPAAAALLTTVLGVILPLALRHRVLGDLVGAGRSTVTLALGALERRGAVARRMEGGWVLLERLDGQPAGRSRQASAAAAPPPGDVATALRRAREDPVGPRPVATLRRRA